MTNDEIPNVEDPPGRDEGMTNVEARNLPRRLGAGTISIFVISDSGFFRHSSFGIRHLRQT
jgi:hypothetical protein